MTGRARSLLKLLFAGCVLATPAGARDLGTRGELFPVIEPDLIVFLKERLVAAQKSGKVDQINATFLANSKKTIERPKPVEGISTTTEPRSWLFDPSMVVQGDVKDTEGHVFARKGDIINPLQHMASFNRVLVFIDGDDPDQVKLAKAKVAELGPERVKPILVKGAPLELMRADRVQFYFDQSGALTRRFGFHHVPAIIQREGDQLRISEVKP